MRSSGTPASSKAPWTRTLSNVDFRDFWFLAPAIVLSVWGLVVLLVDLALARADERPQPAAGRSAGWPSLAWRWLSGHGAG